MTKLSLLLAGLCAVLLLPGCATTPSDPMASTVTRYEKWDRNGDGKIDVTEFNTGLAANRFTYYDKNKDGYIDKTEWVAVRGSGASANALFAQIDTTKDGKIALEEFTNNKTLVAERKANFNRLDKVHKGYLSAKDIEAYFNARSAIEP